MLQLFPFGWTKADGTPHREEIYTNMMTAANCSYTRWTNKRWDHAFLRKYALRILLLPLDIDVSCLQRHVRHQYR